MAPKESSRPKDRHRDRHGDSAKRHQNKKRRSKTTRPETSSDDSHSGRRSNALSADALAQLNRDNVRSKHRSERDKRVRREEYRAAAQHPDKLPRGKDSRKKRRVVSGAIVEEGRAATGLRGGAWSEDSYEKGDYYQRSAPKKRKKKLCKFGDEASTGFDTDDFKGIILGCALVLLIIIIVVAVVVSQKNKNGDSGGSEDSPSGSSNLDGKDRNEIPTKWQNTELDPWSWATTEDFNVTFTDEMVGDLPVMGLFSEWDDSARANENVPALNEDWGSYEKRPARGVNIGGWLYLEPFITPSLFEYDPKLGIIDEYTLMQHLGDKAARIMENHYATYITEDTFRDIQAAGLDHVRIGYNYWAVEVYEGDPYLHRVSWRYLLRAIEWCRKYGLRVNLDIHGIPGSQNGWNHSGRWGILGWLNGSDGEKHAKRSLEIHDRLSKFFAQDRYRNIITHYGLCNEPRMTALKTSDVVSWTETAYKKIRDNGVKALVIFGDGFMGLDNWQGLMPGYDDMVLDVHQYVIFNENQIDFTRQKKVEYACEGWTEQAELSMDPSRGYGPTIFAEWSQADSDCAKHLTNVGWGNRWEGTLDTGDEPSSILTPRCPTKDDRCTCSRFNAGPDKWSKEYKRFLKMFAEAQMHSFEKGWGWFYWTWKTESATLWSYETGLKLGILPPKAWDREFNCDADVPDFEKLGLPEYS
ncbi:putative glucan 1,3-beta-glucosidase D [Paramyrothecium foliicola]|nr:putative glucan 1,3-beta-glucosidase D [Paramyrothecium foliicola]